MDFEQELDWFREQLRQNADPKRANGEKAYLKSAHQFYGVKVPSLRKIAKTWLKQHKSAAIDDVVNLTALIWDSDWHEERSLATLLLQYRDDDLTLKHMLVIEKMINEATSWVYLDALAGWTVGVLIDTDPATLEYFPKWAQSENFWVRRAAIIGQNLQFRRGEGDFDLFARIVVPMFEENPEWSQDERFFIRKAIGWALRELAPHQPERVQNFVRAHRNQMSGLTLREATRKLPDKYKLS